MIPLRDDNPSKSFPFFTISLIVGNIAIFIYQLLHPELVELMSYNYGLIPVEIIKLENIAGSMEVFPLLNFISCIFLHGGWMHLGGNMLYLWIFGDNLEDKLGHFKFLFFYLFMGIIATATHIAASPYSSIPLIGASGAIAGVLGAYVVLFPGAKVHTLFIFIIIFKVIKIPAILLLGVWFYLQISNSMNISDNTAWYAHIGGFIGGAVYIMLFYDWKKNKKIRL